MKAFLWGLGLVLLAGVASGAEIPYQFVNLGVSAQVQDINDAGLILVSGTSPGDKPMIYGKYKYPREVRACRGFADQFDQSTLSSSIEGFAISNLHVVGYCSAGDAGGAARTSGFIIRHNGNLQTLLDVPGAMATTALGVNSKGHVTGMYWLPTGGGSKCFVWKPTTGFTLIEFPIPNSYVSCFGINAAGKVLGEYVTVIPETNENVEHGFFIWDNGSVSVPLPLSWDIIGGPSWYAYDINDDGALIGYHAPNNGTPASLFLYDDGTLFTVPMPQNWWLADLGGINNAGQFVGRTYIDKGVDTDCFEYYQDEDYCTVYEIAGFKASPAPLTVAKGKK